MAIKYKTAVDVGFPCTSVPGPVHTTPHRRPYELLYFTCDLVALAPAGWPDGPRRGVQCVPGAAVLHRGWSKTKHTIGRRAPTVRLPGRRRTSCPTPCVDIMWYLCTRKKKYLPTAKQTRIPIHSRTEMIINDDPTGGRRRVAVQRRPKQSRPSVRPSVVARARPQCACVQSGAEQCACVRPCVRVRAREQRRRRRPAHSRGGKRSQQVGSAARRPLPTTGNSYCLQ